VVCLLWSVVDNSLRVMARHESAIVAVVAIYRAVYFVVRAQMVSRFRAERRSGRMVVTGIVAMMSTVIAGRGRPVSSYG
jgi:hypothetical protein